MSKRGGANSKFTPENRAAVIARLEVGLTVLEAAEGTGLKPATVQGWIARGKREAAEGQESEYAEFAAATERAKGRPTIEPMTEEEHRAKVSEVARKGNVQALKLYWEMIRADSDPDEAEQAEPGSAEALDELAARRAAR